MQNSGPSLFSSRQTSSFGTTLPVDLTYSAFLPTSYTESYAYPLITYIHDQDSFDQSLRKWFPAISDQNFIGLGVRAAFPHPLGFPGEFRWRLNRPDSSLAVIRDTVAHASMNWTIHPERVCLFGEGDGAIVALQHLILQESNQLQLLHSHSLVCRGLPDGWAKWLPPVPETLSGRILFLDSEFGPQDQAACDALKESGIDVTFVAPNSEEHPAQRINHWIMSGISTVIF